MPTLDDVWAEIDATDEDWLNSIPQNDSNSVQCAALQFTADRTVRDLVQKMGEAYGCHTCNRTLDKIKPRFIVDHIPPRGTMATLGVRTIDYHFFPHCDKCASEQATLVIRVQSEPKVLLALRTWRGKRNRVQVDKCRAELKALGLKPKEIALLTGGQGAKCLAGHGEVPRASDITEVNARLKRECHSCNEKRANYVYHADHCPPKQFTMSGWFAGFLASAKDPSGVRDDIVEALKTSFYRPQCPSCSHQQGGRVNKIVNTALKEVNTPTGKMKRTRRIGGRILRTTRVIKYGK